MKKKTIFSAMLSLAVMSLFGCGGGGGGGTATPATGTTTISGVAAKGPISGGVVKVFAIKGGQPDRTAEIGSGSTDGSGNYTVTIAADKKPTGPVLVEVSSGSFTDEASGEAGVVLTAPLQAAVSSVADGDKIAVTPMTHLAFKQVEGIENISAVEIDDANKQVGRFFEVEDIIKSQPFDPTKDAPAGASDDQKKYAGALGAFSQLCDSRKGASKREDSIQNVLKELENELKTDGGFSGKTRDDFNAAIGKFFDPTSGKNKGGIKLTPIVFKGGVLQLQTTGNLPANSEIQALDFTITLPAGVTVNFDAATGEAATGVVAPVGNAATGGFPITKFTPASGTTPASLHVAFIKVKPGFDVGEFAHIEFGLTDGTSLPAKADFVVTVNPNPGVGIVGGSKTDPNASFIDLKASGIDIVTKSVAGL